MYCSNCGKEVQPGAHFCANCGAKIDAFNSNNSSNNNLTIPSADTTQATTSTGERKSKVAAALLAFFVGIFGAHNFYLGYTEKAVAQLLITILSCFVLTGITAIWSFIEFILILCGKIKDSSGRELKD